MWTIRTNSVAPPPEAVIQSTAVIGSFRRGMECMEIGTWRGRIDAVAQLHLRRSAPLNLPELSIR
jgi:hypothetical protein